MLTSTSEMLRLNAELDAWIGLAKAVMSVPEGLEEGDDCGCAAQALLICQQNIFALSPPLPQPVDGLHGTTSMFSGHPCTCTLQWHQSQHVAPGRGQLLAAKKSHLQLSWQAPFVAAG